MNHEKDNFLKFLKLELTHLIDDVSDLIQYEKELHDKNEHTNFVYLENLVVLKDEIMGINGTLGKLDEMFSNFDNSNYVESLQKYLASFVEERGYPLAVLDLINRKIRKIEEMKGLF